MNMNEKIKASEVQLTGINGEDLGVVSTKAALQMAKDLKVDLICLSLSTSPPPCELVHCSDAKQKKVKENQQKRKVDQGGKVKELRLSAWIEDHDYETKKRQAEKILTSGDTVQLTVRLERKESQEAKAVVERLINELAHCGKQEKGIQVSGKQVIAVVVPL
jgi:translation initiation factor IF-3